MDRKREVEMYLKKKKQRNILISNLKGLFVILTVLMNLIFCMHMFVYRMQNPSLTGTELMIYAIIKFWWLGIMAFISGLLV